MAEIFKRLGAVNPSANTDTSIYTVPSNASAIISSLSVCNTANSAVSGVLGLSSNFRMAICSGAINDVTLADYIYYDVIIEPYDTFIATVGFTIAANSQILVRANTDTVAFSLFGSEIT